MRRVHWLRLRELFESMLVVIDEMEWTDGDALEEDVHSDRECDGSWDYGVGDFPCSSIDDDLPDETDQGPRGPLCVECGNWYDSCVC